MDSSGCSQGDRIDADLTANLKIMIAVIILLVVLGLVFWGLNFLPVGEPFMTIIKVVLVLIGLVALLEAVGINTGLPSGI